MGLHAVKRIARMKANIVANPIANAFNPEERTKSSKSTLRSQVSGDLLKSGS